MLNAGSITALLIGAAGFILGYITKTIISYEYTALREARKQRAREIEEWTQEIDLLLIELRQLTREFSHEKRPDIDEWVDELDYLSKEIEKVTTNSPDGIDDKLEEELQYLAGMCDAHETVLADLYIEIYGESEGRDELPMPFEYDEVAIDGNIQTDRVLRHMCEFIHEETDEQISKIEDLMESPVVEKSRLARIKQLIR